MAAAVLLMLGTVSPVLICALLSARGTNVTEHSTRLLKISMLMTMMPSLEAA